jgi:hypothetical protein
VIAVAVDVHGPTGDQHRRGGVLSQRKQEPGVGARKADAIDEQVGAVPQGSVQLITVSSVRRNETTSRGSDIARHMGGIPACNVHLPSGGQEPSSGSTTDQAGTTEDQRTGHKATLGKASGFRGRQFGDSWKPAAEAFSREQKKRSSRGVTAYAGLPGAVYV